MRDIVFVAATNNAKKFLELRSNLASAGYDCISLAQAGITCEAEENGRTFQNNAYIKAKAVYDLYHGPVIADDSGLVVDCLDGQPGVYSARYAGISASDEQNIDKLLSVMNHVPMEERSARFVSVLCAILDDKTVMYSRGTCEGSIGNERRGQGGFGYDPIFWVTGNRSVAELSPTHKDTISHRGRAMRKMAFKLHGIRKIHLSDGRRK